MSFEYSSKNFVEFLKRAEAQNVRYWYGTTGRNCTTSLYNSKSKQYPAYYTPSRETKYKDDIAKKRICVDCIGLLKAFMWHDDPFDFLSCDRTSNEVTRHRKANGMDDWSANGCFNAAKKAGVKYGTISSIPEVPGIAVRYSGHIGYYIGNGEVIEARGFNYGVVKTKLKNRAWTDWFYLPCINYNGGEQITSLLGQRNLKKGLVGADVKEMQAGLIQLNYDLGKWGADGDFGKATDTAVKKFQSDNKLEVDGIFGKKSLAAYKKLIN